MPTPTDGPPFDCPDCYGRPRGLCPNCGQIGPEDIDSDTPGHPGPFYRLCEDAECRYLRAADPPRVHYHYIGPDRADSDC